MSATKPFPNVGRHRGARSGARRGPSAAAPGTALALAMAALLALPVGGEAQTQSQGSIEDRVGRIERMLDTGTLIQLLESVKALQSEVRALRGEIELQGHRLNQLEGRQRELYLDVDRRLQRLEAATTATAAGGVSPDTAPAAASGASAGTSAGAGVAAGTGAAAGAGATAAGSGTAVAAAQPPAAGPATQAAAGDDGIEEQQAYQAAFNLLKAGRYEQATKSFRGFLDQYPTGRYSDNAQYWLGETYYVTRKFDEALGEFQKLVAQHPQSQKLTHAILKIGFIQDEKGQKDLARKTLTGLVEQYPDSTAAGLAKKRLERLGSQ